MVRLEFHVEREEDEFEVDVGVRRVSVGMARLSVDVGLMWNGQKDTGEVQGQVVLVDGVCTIREWASFRE